MCIPPECQQLPDQRRTRDADLSQRSGGLHQGQQRQLLMRISEGNIKRSIVQINNKYRKMSDRDRQVTKEVFSSSVLFEIITPRISMKQSKSLHVFSFQYTFDKGS